MYPYLSLIIRDNPYEMPSKSPPFSAKKKGKKAE